MNSLQQILAGNYHRTRLEAGFDREQQKWKIEVKIRTFKGPEKIVCWDTLIEACSDESLNVAIEWADRCAGEIIESGFPTEAHHD